MGSCCRSGVPRAPLADGSIACFLRARPATRWRESTLRRGWSFVAAGSCCRDDGRCSTRCREAPCRSAWQPATRTGGIRRGNLRPGPLAFGPVLARRVASASALAALALACAGAERGSDPSATPSSAVEVQPVPSAEASSSDQPPPPRSSPREPRVCDAPDQPGCNPCCAPLDDGRCVVRTWFTAGVDTGDITPWYNAGAVEDQCPEGCLPCARCDRRARQDIERLGQRPECDCSKPPGLDPCIVRSSCGCFCERAKRLAAQCPKLIEVPGVK